MTGQCRLSSDEDRTYNSDPVFVPFLGLKSQGEKGTDITDLLRLEK